MAIKPQTLNAAAECCLLQRKNGRAYYHGVSRIFVGIVPQRVEVIIEEEVSSGGNYGEGREIQTLMRRLLLLH